MHNLSISDITLENYEKYRELEHQIGRLYFMYKIIQRIVKLGIPGDFIEFGVYKGFSLIWLAYLKNLCGLYNRKVIGVDSFKGFPEETDYWKFGIFEDTSYDMVNEIIKKSIDYKDIVIIESWFNNSKLPDIFQKETRSLSLIHIDCDLKKSVNEVFYLIEPFLKGTQFLLFDDWGIVEEDIKSCFDTWLHNHPSTTAKLFSTTGITKYYEIKTD
uniref:Putative methyltransferase n=1 Tax=viral metagenome TaxID=1070528 RepID=A0A6M3XHS6_9ZZZZ